MQVADPDKQTRPSWPFCHTSVLSRHGDGPMVPSMLSRICPPVCVRRRGFRSLTAITPAVLAGLAFSAFVNVWIEAPPSHALPGVALGSQTLLVAERGLAFFAIWLLILVVVVQALKGRLPIEISGRGLRYASGDETQDSLVVTQQALSRLDDETEALRRKLEGLTIDRIDP